MNVLINGVNITDHINESSYRIDADRKYKSWNDGNGRQHRIYTTEKVNGTFTVALYGKDGMDLDAFLELWKTAVKDNVVTIALWVNNLGKMKLIEAYYTFTMKKHTKVNDRYVDLLEIKLEER